MVESDKITTETVDGETTVVTMVVGTSIVEEGVATSEIVAVGSVAERGDDGDGVTTTVDTGITGADTVGPGVVIEGVIVIRRVEKGVVEEEGIE